LGKAFLLECRNISKSFPGVKALDNVDLEVQNGEVHAIVGENGAGKSTLMNILSGNYAQNTGKIYLDGTEVHLRDPRQAQELGIAMIHQELSLASNLSIMENIYIGRLKRNRLGFVNYKEMYKRSKEQLECVGITNVEPDQLIKDLSISQMQMVEIAKALSLNAKLIIMDEPTSSLTRKESELLFATIRSLKNSGVTVLYISHRLQEIFDISDRITVLRDGKQIETLDTKETSEKEIISLMVGREFNKSFHRVPRVIGEKDRPVLEIKGLSSSHQKLTDINLKLYAGEVLALTGLVGSGRTELVQTIFGIGRRDAGEIYLNGEKISADSPSQAIKLGMGLVPEGRKTQGLFSGMTVRENMTIVNIRKTCRCLFISRKSETKNALSYVSTLRIKTPNIEQKVKFLSGGNQQKTIIARWLLNNPKVLFLDEPTHGVDVGAKEEIYAIINDLAQAGVGIILISSELPEVLTLADRILVMHNGRIAGELSQNDANQEIIMQYATNQI
jgi:ABC-type sugar transport system ATPase subunit